MKRTRPVLLALLGALAASASLAFACGMSIHPTITAGASDVLAGRASGTIVLKLQGLQGRGVVRVYLDDGTNKAYAAQGDPRYIGYATGESSAPHNATIVVTNPEALRRAAHAGSVRLRFVSDGGDAKVKSATIDAPR